MGHRLQVEGVCWPRLQAHSSPPAFLQTRSAANTRQSCSEGKSRREPSPGTQQLRSEWLWVLHRAHPPSRPLPVLDETSLPQILPICEVTDRFTAKRGKRQPGTWKREQEERCRLCCILRNLCLTQTQDNFPEPRGSQLRCSWCTLLPSRRDKHVSVREEANTVRPLLEASAQRSGISPSVWCLLAAPITGHKGCAGASHDSHPTSVQ